MAPLRIGLLLSIVALACASLLFSEGVTIDLKDPSYADGLFRTTEGGVVSTEGVRIQAKTIVYERQTGEREVSRVTAEGQLLLLYGDKQFIGRRLEYDFIEKSGVLYNGRAAAGIWIVGGERIELRPDGSYQVLCGFLTTCEESPRDWEIRCRRMDIYSGEKVYAKHVEFRAGSMPFFYVPSYTANLARTVDIPIETKVSVGGTPGTRASFRYRAWDWNDFQCYLRLDLLLRRGLGGGVDTDWKSPSGLGTLSTRNYMAHDLSIEDPTLRMRYRFNGLYKHQFPHHNVRLHGIYDKVSDNEVPTDYSNHSFDLPTARLTYFSAVKEEENWIGRVTSRVRINSFQTVNQELPSADVLIRPLSLAGVISETRVQGAYLDYVMGNQISTRVDYHSGRLCAQQALYAPLAWRGMVLTPRAGVTAIGYSNSPASASPTDLLLMAGGELQTSFHKVYGQKKHIVKPYADYAFVSNPSSRFLDHYIFSIQDGFANISMLRFGLQNQLFTQSEEGRLRPLVDLDLYANAFFQMGGIGRAIPKYYAHVTAYPLPTVSFYLHTAWNDEYRVIDHSKVGFGWTLSETLAFNVDYLSRSRFDWRKADTQNFVVDLLRSQEELLASPLSDRRDTLLFRGFCRLTPTWACELRTRNGWRREDQPNYFEFKINLLGRLSCQWKVKLSFEHHVDGDNRFSLGVHLGGKETITAPPIW